jgi:hypothetical protein
VLEAQEIHLANVRQAFIIRVSLAAFSLLAN